ncbi:hypothetical protein [Streptococcus fryi]
MPNPPGQLSDLADRLQTFAKNLEGSLDERREYLDNIAIDERIGSLGQDIIVKESVPSEEVNTWWAMQGYTEPPYTPKTSVQLIELVNDTKFVRVYDGENSALYGGWLMKAEDINGLSSSQIQEKFALPHTPIYIGEVTIPKGSRLRMGEVNPLFGYQGGGVQFDLMGQYIGEFKELGKIVN